MCQEIRFFSILILMCRLSKKISRTGSTHGWQNDSRNSWKKLLLVVVPWRGGVSQNFKNQFQTLWQNDSRNSRKKLLLVGVPWRRGLSQNFNFFFPYRCFSEMRDAGITAVGEFHYFHHAKPRHTSVDGTSSSQQEEDRRDDQFKYDALILDAAHACGML